MLGAFKTRVLLLVLYSAEDAARICLFKTFRAFIN